MIRITRKNRQECCGCGACSQVCPKKCIAMKADKEGFLYPGVDTDSCVDCGRCESVCPVILAKQKSQEGAATKPQAYGGYHRKEEVRKKSSSGGAFSLLAEAILQEGGAVFGAALDENLRVRHIAVTNEAELEALRGSKYVQSAVGDTYREAKEFLRQGRPVLYSGTPCQTAGLRAFLGGSPEKLVTVDFICHGVPSPAVFARYLENLQETYGQPLTDFRFRLKDKGWQASGLQLGTQFTLADGRVIRHYPAFRDVFMNGFLDDICLRPICHACPFKELPHTASDITIADFWGVQGVDASLDDKRGTSLVLVHTAAGQELFDRVKADFDGHACDFAASIRRNKSLVTSAAPNPRREAFFRDFRSLPFEKVRKKYLTAWQWGSHKAMKILKSRLKRKA